MTFAKGAIGKSISVSKVTELSDIGVIDHDGRIVSNVLDCALVAVWILLEQAALISVVICNCYVALGTWQSRERSITNSMITTAWLFRIGHWRTLMRLSSIVVMPLISSQELLLS